ncbi:nucleoporin Nup45 [Schizosaccharomyces japonicus yFS275]|uniref:Nucleoporin Nup45 n=1 Tax=Schizosaccharomyces japonicus (strain yFS275 / FY16936) TaxID=402676 RepID=B6JX35_SCHJY|nr:nucleoporin Nup45 [Schizosaccharomyces japonicus yFS275]EEB05936.2 nucleoporin Nup45 [Schizosaccharomyces japonicus yFS275]
MFGSNKPLFSFGSTNTAAPAFGQQNNAGTNTQPGAGLLNQTTTNVPATNTGGLFGQAATKQPATTTSLFGQKPATTTTTTPSLFGQTQQQQPAAGTSLFGGSGFNQQQQQQQTQPVFGSTTGGGLFGQQNTATTTKPSFGLFGQQQPQQQQQAVPQANTVASNVTPIQSTTRFSALDAATQNALDSIEKEIFAQIQLSETVNESAAQVRQLVDTVPNDVAEVERRLSSTSTALETDADCLEDVKNIVDKDTINARISTRIIDVMKTPGAVLPHTSNDPLVNYFDEFVRDAKKRTQVYAATIGELEQHLEQVESMPQNNSPEALVRSLKEEHKLFMALSNRFAQVHDEVKRLQISAGSVNGFRK